jgi:mannan endo-1,6-alpha-mannosidase
MFWGLAAITAAEYNFPNRPNADTWLTLAIRVFNDQKDTGHGGWEETICGGGVRWQKDVWQGGYTMKNSVSNGGFFMLAARIAWFTQQDKYAEWAEKVWDWATDVNLVNNKTWAVGDSVSQGKDGGCSGPDNMRWTYNYGTFLSGAAYMYAYVSIKVCLLLLLQADDSRQTRVNGLIAPVT